DLILNTKFIYTDGTQFGDVNKAKIIMEPGKRAQMLAIVPGFPIGQTGDYTVTTWVEEHERVVAGPIEFKLGLEIVSSPQEATPSQTIQAP
ncbi:MAG: hypothetical protein WA736_02590, partial [Candidatus Acidiferrum sp.]